MKTGQTSALFPALPNLKPILKQWFKKGQNMPKKQDLRAVAIVTVGVMLAGFLMFQFRDVQLVGQASAGYNG